MTVRCLCVRIFVLSVLRILLIRSHSCHEETWPIDVDSMSSTARFSRIQS